MQSPGPDVFRQVVHLLGCFGDVGHGFILEHDFHAIGPQQRNILQQKGVLGFGQYPVELGAAQRIQLHPYGKTPLQFGYEVRWLHRVKSTRANEKDVVGPHRAILGGHGSAFHNGQQIPLHPFPGNIRALTAVFAGNLIDFIQKNDTVLFDLFDGQLDDTIHVHEVLGLFLRQSL